MDTSIPWVEKYRPKMFEDIILDELTKTILTNIIKTNVFPHILAYGFPGTGKTTTIINTINKYFEVYHKTNMADVIHLNASDDRGIDIIRNQIHAFASSKSLFQPLVKNAASAETTITTTTTNLKFVILDEVDYMTKNAQQALKYLIQTTGCEIRFLLMCNYISRIDEGLQNEFVKLHFNIIEPEKIIDFLQNICQNEQLTFSRMDLQYVRKIFVYDIRSMINYIQMNQHSLSNILQEIIFVELFDMFCSENKNQTRLQEYIFMKCQEFHVCAKQFVLYFLHFLLRTQKAFFYQSKTLDFVQLLLHNRDSSNTEFVAFFVKSLLKRLLLEKINVER